MDTEAYEVETPSSLTSEGPPSFPSQGAGGDDTIPPLSYEQLLAIAGPVSMNNYEVVPSSGLALSQSGSGGVGSSHSHPSGAIQNTLEAITAQVSGSSGVPVEIGATGSRSKASVSIINESVITLLLKLHAKYSGKSDSYTPLKQRSGMSVTPEYR